MYVTIFKETLGEDEVEEVRRHKALGVRVPWDEEAGNFRVEPMDDLSYATKILGMCFLIVLTFLTCAEEEQEQKESYQSPAWFYLGVFITILSKMTPSGKAYASKEESHEFTNTFRDVIILLLLVRTLTARVTWSCLKSAKSVFNLALVSLLCFNLILIAWKAKNINLESENEQSDQSLPIYQAFGLLASIGLALMS